jgi:hypothetical protein
MNLGKTVSVENVVDIEIDNKVVAKAINDATVVEVTTVEANTSVNA